MALSPELVAALAKARGLSYSDAPGAVYAGNNSNFGRYVQYGGKTYYIAPSQSATFNDQGTTIGIGPQTWAKGTPYTYTQMVPAAGMDASSGAGPTAKQMTGRVFEVDPWAQSDAQVYGGHGGSFWTQNGGLALGAIAAAPFLAGALAGGAGAAGGAGGAGAAGAGAGAAGGAIGGLGTGAATGSGLGLTAGGGLGLTGGGGLGLSAGAADAALTSMLPAYAGGAAGAGAGIGAAAGGGAAGGAGAIGGAAGTAGTAAGAGSLLGSTPSAVIPAALSGGGAVLSGLIGAGASKSAANTQADAAKYAANLANQQWQQTQANLKPYLNSGYGGLGMLDYLMGIQPHDAAGNPVPLGAIGQSGAGGFGSLLQPFDLTKFQQSPSYQFNLQQGQQAINKAAAARGNYYAPQTLQDISKFSQGLAGNEWMNAYNMYNQDQSNQFNRLASIAGQGQNAAVQQGTFGANAANVIGQNVVGGANAQAAGTIGQANAYTGAIMGGANAAQNAYNNYLMNQMLQQQQLSGYA